MRRKCSAAAIAPQKNLILPQDKSRNARCLQFAARLVGRVNVRGLRESQIEVKCFPRRRISSRMMRRSFCASPSMRCRRLNGRSNFYSRMTIAHALWRKRLHRHGFLRQTTRFEAAKVADCHQFAATRLALAARLRLFASHFPVAAQCTLNASAAAGFRLDLIAQSRFCRKRQSGSLLDSGLLRCARNDERRSSRSAFRVSRRVARGQKSANKTHSE
jgi:hypothetical protein